MALAALIVAVIAATVSLLSFGWTITWSLWQHRQLAHPHVRLRASFGFLPDRPNLLALVLTATNVGHVTVTITGAKIVVADAPKHIALITWVVQTPGPLPVVLEPGRSWNGITDAAAVQQGLPALSGRPGAKARAVVTDAADTEYASKVIPFS